MHQRYLSSEIPNGCNIQILKTVSLRTANEMDWNNLKWIQIFRNIDSRMLKWMLFNPAFLFIYRSCMEHICMPFNLKIILTFSVMSTIQFKILNRKCNFSIQLNLIESNWIQLNPKKSIRYLKYIFNIHSNRKKFQSILIHSRLLSSL